MMPAYRDSLDTVARHLVCYWNKLNDGANVDALLPAMRELAKLTPNADLRRVLAEYDRIVNCLRRAGTA